MVYRDCGDYKSQIERSCAFPSINSQKFSGSYSKMLGLFSEDKLSAGHKSMYTLPAN